jgi:FemAB-related protein (PEP-CTERM system-associated)
MSDKPVETKLFTATANEWDGFVRVQALGTAAHLFGWKRVVERVYGHECPYLAAYEGCVLTGVLPLVDVRSLAFGRFIVSMPYLNTGGPIGSAAAVQALVQHAAELARVRKAALLELRSTAEQELPLEPHTGKVTSVLALPGDGETLWAALPSKLRSQIRKPQKAGVEMRFGADQLEPFFTVFARNMRDLGSPTHPLRFFQSIQQQFGDLVWFGCAYYGGKPVAGGCALHFGSELEMTWASSLRSFNHLSANMLLYWKFIEHAANAGLQQFNFGRSTPGSSTHRFKQQWGAVDVPLHWYRESLRPHAGPPARETDRQSLAERVWQRMPLALATAIGPRLRGGIPA